MPFSELDWNLMLTSGTYQFNEGLKGKTGPTLITCKFSMYAHDRGDGAIAVVFMPSDYLGPMHIDA